MSDYDKLYEAAFDGDDRDVEAARSRLIGRDADEFNALLTLKSDLKALRDVPECQLTTDHLRRAILNQKPVPVSKAWPKVLTWTSMAAAAGLMLVAVAKFGPAGATGSSHPIVAINSPSATNFTDDPANEATAESVIPDVLSAPTAEVAAVDPATSREDTVRHRPSRRVFDSRVSPPAAASKTASAASGPAGGAEALKQPADESALIVAPNTELSAERHNETVVVVSDHANPATGAADAREVSRPTDVVFGG